MGAVLLGVAGCAPGIALYFLTRKGKFVITSVGSSKISFGVSGTSFAKTMGLLEEIEGRKKGVGQLL